MADINTDSNISQSSNDGMENMYLNFSVNSEIYSIEIRYVIQIIGMQNIVEVPDMPMYMKGFINLRGNIIPVVSMRLRFEKFEEAYSDRTCIIVVKIGDKEIGIIVDAIQETTIIESENISPPPVIKEIKDNAYIMGIAKLSNNSSSVILNLNKLFYEQL